MNFQFRFKTILNLRRRERDEAGGEVAQAHQAIARLEDEIETIRQVRQQLQRETQRRRLGEVSVDDLLSQGRYDLQLQAQMHSLHATLNQLQVELQRRSQRLVEAEAEVKRFERLEENDLAVYRRELAKREQVELDEAAARRFLLNRNG